MASFPQSYTTLTLYVFSRNEGKLCEHLTQLIDINTPSGNEENQIVFFLNGMNQLRNCKAINIWDFEFNSMHWENDTC